MATTDVKTLLNLDDYNKIMGGHPLHFNQVDVPGLANVQNCPGVILQYSWQGADKTGREELAECIADAETSITQELGFSPGPTWALGEFQRMVTPSNPTLVPRWSFTPAGFLQSMQLPTGYFIQGGLETQTSIEAGSTVTYTDVDGDGYAETATIVTGVAAPSGTTAGEIQVTYPGAPDLIIPTESVSIDATTGIVTIVSKTERFALWDLLIALDATGVDGLDLTNFLATVDVYRHWTDPSQQLQWRWENDLSPFPYAFATACSCNNTGTCASCTFVTQAGCLRMRDERLGIVVGQPGTWDAATNAYTRDMWTGCRVPDAVLLWYKHGLVDAQGNMPARWKKAIAYLASARLARPLMACQQLENYAKYWSENYALVLDSGRYQITPRITDNPLGTTRAAEYVWRMIQKEKIGAAAVNL